MTTANPIITTQKTTTQTNTLTTTVIPTTNIDEIAVFTVSDLPTEPEVATADDFFSIIVTVTNTGSS